MQLKINEAFELCRYEWMREALEAFLRVMAEERKTEMGEEVAEAPSGRVAVSDVVADCQMISSSSSSNCNVKKASSSHHVISHINSLKWHLPLKRVAADMS